MDKHIKDNLDPLSGDGDGNEDEVLDENDIERVIDLPDDGGKVLLIVPDLAFSHINYITTLMSDSYFLMTLLFIAGLNALSKDLF